MKFPVGDDGVPLRPRARVKCEERLKDVFDTDRCVFTGPVLGNGFGLFVSGGDCQYRNVRVIRR